MPNDCACVPQAEADAAAKAARAAERAANKALPKADRKSIYSPEVRAKISEGLRKRWRDPAYRASRNYTASNATRLKLSEAMKAKWKDGSFRQRNTVDGLVHPNPNNNSNPNSGTAKRATLTKANASPPSFARSSELEKSGQWPVSW